MVVPPREARVLVVEDHALFGETLAIALRIEGYEVHRLLLTDGGDLVAAAVRARPSIALVDLDLGCYGDGTDLISPLRDAGAAVVVVTGSTDRAQWGGCLHRGAATVLSKSSPLDATLATVRRLALGLPAMSRLDRGALLDLWRREGRERDVLRERFARLTPRERQVLAALVSGMTIRDIAVADFVSEATVRTQVKTILGKLEVGSQVGAVTFAHRFGWHATGPLTRHAV